MTPDAGARIVDRGYQHYDGARLGQAHAARVMIWASIKRGLGLKRSFRVKFLPWLLILGAFAPALFVVAFLVVNQGPPHAAPPCYGLISSTVSVVYVLFAGFIAPDMLCLDRQERVLSLYFAAPITRLLYVGAQVAAMAALMALLTVAPLLVIYAGNTMLAHDALAYLRGHLGDLWHIVLGGGLLAVYFSALSTAVASFTNRRAYASGSFVGLLLVSAVVGGVLSTELHQNGQKWLGFFDVTWFALLDLVNLPLRVVRALFGETVLPAIDVGATTVVTLVVIALSLALLAWRYARMRD